MTRPIAHRTAHVVAGLLAAGLLAAATGAMAQSDAPVSQPQGQPQGPFGLMMQFFEEGTAAFRDHLDRAGDRFDELDERARTTGRGAAETVRRLPNTRVVRGHERCTVAANGAPDCVPAAEKLCRERGFSTGRSVDFTAAETCPPTAWASGRLERSQCATTTFITRAVCQ